MSWDYLLKTYGFLMPLLVWVIFSAIEQRQNMRDTLEELKRMRDALDEHQHWLSEFPSVSRVLYNIQARALGQGWTKPPSPDGPWEISDLRDLLRARRERSCYAAEEVARPALQLMIRHLMPSVIKTVAPQLNREASIRLSNGKDFRFSEPDACEFTVVEIAAALSKLCRFTGHCRTFYSVAQHAVLVSYAVPPEHAYDALHHDDAEAFINDLASPLKRQLGDYLAIEAVVERAVFDRLGVSEQLDPCIKRADQQLLAAEQRDLMPPGSSDWALERGIPMLPDLIVPWSPQDAEAAYLRRHYELLLLREGTPIRDPHAIDAAMADCEDLGPTTT